MSLFKLKNKKIINYDNRCTLDVKHNNILKKLNEDKENISLLKKRIISYKKKIELYNNNFDINNITLLYQTKKKLEELEQKLEDIVTNKDTHSYYLDASDILSSYYNKEDTDKHPHNSVIDFFNNIEKEESKNKISYYINKKDISNKALLLEEFLKKTNDSDFILKQKLVYNYNFCSLCKREMYINHIDGILICENCGYIKNIIIDSDKPNYKDPPPEISYFAYKRINHFNEWLAQFQAKESTDVPPEVFNKIILEIKKERIPNMAQLNNTKIREYLKKLKLNKFYEHVPHIINKINGIPPPIISKEMENKLRLMFKEIQAPFSQVCPKERKNFLSYSYVLHKFVELLDLDEYKTCFPLLKSREKLHQQDMIWKDICKILGWQYIKSI
jgi:hypothetical protein